MYIKSLAVTNFRCFESLKITFDEQVTLIEGCNGSGKTSLLEALHYACFMRSFRTPSPKQMIRFEAPAFTAKLQGETDGHAWQLLVGASPEQRSAKMDGKAVANHREILERYRVLTITEEDLALISGYPEGRRHFLDTIIFLINPEYGKLVKAYYQTLKQRSALLAQPRLDHEAYEIWTTALQTSSLEIQSQRRQLIQALEREAQQLLMQHCGEAAADVRFTYHAREYSDSRAQQEIEQRRTLFGAHLDDMTVVLSDAQARRYASRGQQKMLVVMIKLAAIQIVNKPTLLLLDDLMADFDRGRLEQIIAALLTQRSQLVVTCPLEKSAVADILGAHRQTHKITLQMQESGTIAMETAYATRARNEVFR